MLAISFECPQGKRQPKSNMCGIIGYLGKQKAATIILKGLAVALQRDVDKPRILAKSVVVE
ncbi:MAG: hypothetical protein EXS34_04825 [Lacunisphaera sp.]|nr:hypothetical protein [Lacunisphaera sp.]